MATKILLSFFVFFTSIGGVFACSCFQVSLQDRFTGAKSVSVASVEKVSKMHITSLSGEKVESFTYSINTKVVLTGSINTGISIIMEDILSNTSCGYKGLEEGKTYIIYDSGFNPYSIQECGGTKVFEALEYIELKRIAGKKLSPKENLILWLNNIKVMRQKK